MNSPLNKLPGAKSLLSVQTIVLAGIAWAVLALLFFLLFSVQVAGPDGIVRRASWYLIGTYVFEEVAYLAAAILCFRNWRSPNIVSGRNVWLGFGLGMLSYFVGTLLFGYWELGLHIEPDVSPGDFFYITSYMALGCSMILAVKSRRLNLESWQWGIVAGIGAIGILLAWLISVSALTAQHQPIPVTTVPPTVFVASHTSPTIATVSQINSLSVASPTAPTPSSDLKQTPDLAPQWAAVLEEQLKPLGPIVNLIYVIFDVFLLILATMLLLAFWGGRFSQSWRMIAAAVFSLYIADMWLKYAENHIENYQSGSLLEVFWVFSGVLFAIGATLEYDISSRSRRAGGRKRA